MPRCIGMTSVYPGLGVHIELVTADMAFSH